MCGFFLQIAGLDAYHVREQAASEEFLNAHILGLRQVTRFRNSYIIFIPEANLAPYAARYTECVRHRQRFVPLYHNSNPTVPGVVTTNDNKQKYVESIQTHLMLDTLWFDPELVAANPIPRTEDAMAEYKRELKPKLMRELRNFREIKRPGIFRDAAPILSGKVNDEGRIVSGFTDDRVITLGMASYWAREVIRGATQLDLSRLI